MIPPCKSIVQWLSSILKYPLFLHLRHLYDTRDNSPCTGAILEYNHYGKNDGMIIDGDVDADPWEEGIYHKCNPFI
jgi:hypothetical protein